MLLKVIHAGKKYNVGQYRCDACGQEYEKRIRPRVVDTCGCKPRGWGGKNWRHGEDCSRGPSPELKAFRKMHERCASSACKDYPNYGGRGITVCPRWSDFKNFLEDMGRRPGPAYSVERIDVNRGYAPENCRWATRREQARNTRRNHYVTVSGRTQIVAEWLRELSLSRTTFYRKLREGFTAEWLILAALAARNRVSECRGDPDEV